MIKSYLNEECFTFSNHIYNLCLTRHHDYTLHVIYMCYCYGCFSFVAKHRNLTQFILKLMTELRL